MTRTERNQYPAALLKDKHSRSGLTRSDMQHKQGAGAHNWGSIRQVGDMESQAEADAGEGMFDMDNDNDAVGELPATPKQRGASGDNLDMALGAGANKDLMKDAISTSPTDSMASLDSVSPKDGGPGGAGVKGRRMSNVSDEERERARVYREGVMAGGGPVNLANIARTSFGVASPPNGNGFAGMAGTSPTKYKSAA